MKKIVLAVLGYMMVWLGVASYGQAAETILFFAPTRIELTENNPVQEIRVTNMSNTVRSYSLASENIVMNENGVTEQVQDFSFSAKRMIRFVPHKFDIQPGQKQIIRIMGRYTPDMQDGEYHMHINFLENLSRSATLNQSAQSDNKAAASAQIAYSTSIPVIISKGNIKTEIGMKDMQLTQDNEGRPTVKMVLTRSGNGQGNALLEAYYTAPDGKEVMAGVRRTVAIYREIDKRDYNFTLELLNAAKLPAGGKVTIKLFNKNISQDEPVDTIVIPVQ